MNTFFIPVIVIATISFYAGLNHLLIYFRQRQHREDLTFALMCITIGFYDLFCAGLYNSNSVAEGVHWQRLQFIALPFLNITFLWFFTTYTHHKNKKFSYVLSLFYLVAILVQIIDRSSLTWLVDHPSIKDIILPFGIRVTYYEATLGLFTTIQGLMGIVVSIYIVWNGVRFYRSGYRREAGPLLIALVFLFVAAINDTAVSDNLYHFIYIIEYAYLAMILVMAYSLSSTIVEATKIKETLMESEERFRSLFETSPESVTLIDLQGTIQDCNTVTEQIAGMKREELIGKPFMELGVLTEKDLPKYFELFSYLIAGGIPAPLQVESVRQGNETRWIEVFPALLKKDNRIYAIQVIARDISERKRAEAERENLIKELEIRNAELERFTYTVSHDLKSPLITIRGFIGFLEKNATSGNLDQFRSDLSRITAATNKMQRLLTELLELSRIGRMLNPPEPMNFTQLAREAVEMIQGQIEARGIQVHIEENLPCILGDRARLLEVVQNLVNNAVKFMGNQANPRIRVGQKSTDTDGKPIFFVQDNGIGIESQYQERIFGLFNKLDAQTDGTGVGLALVKRIIEVHDGRIWVESQGNRTGSTFYFTLPIPSH